MYHSKLECAEHVVAIHFAEERVLAIDAAVCCCRLVIFLFLPNSLVAILLLF